MTKLNWKKEAVIWLIMLAPFIYAIVMWSKVPETVPAHFNMKGEPDDYSSKEFALLLLPVMNILVYLILFFIPRIDPRRKNYNFFGASYQNIRLIIHLFFVGVFIYITSAIAGDKPVYTNAFFAGMFLFFALLGNYMRTVRSNFFVGIRTPWTLSNDIVWRKTHELGGKLWFYSGMAGAIVVLFLTEMAGAIFLGGTLFIIAMIPIVYSYFEYQKVMKSSKSENISQ